MPTSSPTDPTLPPDPSREPDSSGGPKQILQPYQGVAEVQPEYKWPDDFTRLDNGQLLVRPDYEAVFADLRWTSVQAVMNSDRVRVMRHKDDRQNCQVDLPDPSGPGTIRGFLKRHWVDRRKRKLYQRLFDRHKPIQASVPPGLAEARAVGWCQQAAVPTLEVIAAGGQQLPDGSIQHGRAIESESFFLSRDLAPAETADQFWQYRLGKPGSPDRRVQALRRSTIEALAQTARRFHRAQLYHRDFYWCHFYIRQHANEKVSAHLIDLQRVRRAPRNAFRWLMKDLGGIRFSMPGQFMTRDEIRHWYKCYFGQDGEPKSLILNDHFLCGLIRMRAEVYRQKENRQDAERIRRRYETA